MLCTQIQWLDTKQQAAAWGPDNSLVEYSLLANPVVLCHLLFPQLQHSFEQGFRGCCWAEHDKAQAEAAVPRQPADQLAEAEAYQTVLGCSGRVPNDYIVWQGSQ